MDTVWLKIAVIVVVIVGIVIGVNWVMESLTKQAQPEKTIGDQWREDEKRLRAEPNIPPPPPEANQPAPEQKPIKFTELTEEQKAGAEQLFEYALKFREMGRLPGMGYKKMIDACRDIIEKYPGSEYAYKARRMLGDIPQAERERWGVTDKEIDLNQN
jgi:hypothetical protein